MQALSITFVLLVSTAVGNAYHKYVDMELERDAHYANYDSTTGNIKTGHNVLNAVTHTRTYGIPTASSHHQHIHHSHSEPLSAAHHNPSVHHSKHHSMHHAEHPFMGQRLSSYRQQSVPAQSLIIVKLLQPIVIPIVKTIEKQSNEFDNHLSHGETRWQMAARLMRDSDRNHHHAHRCGNNGPNMHEHHGHGHHAHYRHHTSESSEMHPEHENVFVTVNVN